jgi:hypothetical protein
MNCRSLALAIAALLACITSASAQSVYVAPGGTYIGSGPVYVIPAPSNGDGTDAEPPYDYSYGVPNLTPSLAPRVVVPGASYGALAADDGLNANGYGPPPAYYDSGYLRDTLGGDRMIGWDPDPFIRGELLRHHSLGYN